MCVLPYCWCSGRVFNWSVIMKCTLFLVIPELRQIFVKGKHRQQGSTAEARLNVASKRHFYVGVACNELNVVHALQVCRRSCRISRAHPSWSVVRRNNAVSSTCAGHL
jgi:hypothetical protein